ncbi:SusD/RagB family nutrient-binding outer membrane lipoprotein [Mucilaginibacter sp. L3T2-6]|uniref:SusD/RagB family nutrient-binding outer membrane lipoprotein n=1 Tax=Mucilaginibacter sp. L3T2-6 TaxID=3062491 RepID=UPI0026772667|nr:SusD/RagB family nutrient-binding outer membrane lipoprotein [Mucilaginibacter sp. L3T2-6]MDO3642057.1 SusD/RagB family nutrient-binding outer membrane lipoprotein [Mucilaginibacter sp. L3T2-6]MDV6214551.1 SusD/RagB family nutrient-binding outer membrane lipoprotein [Mucilaginibacter sp. L3T2-6]
MKRIYICGLAGLFLLGGVSCKKPNDFGTTNVNPDAVNNPIVPALLATVENNVPFYSTTLNYGLSGGSFAQYFSETQYPGVSLYTAPVQNFTGNYVTDLGDCQTVINLNQSKNSVAVATILQQYLFWVLTDNFGDIPYSQALQGLKSITPAYDKQEDIYKGILTKVAAAVASMDGGTVPGDLYYNGDAASWKRAGNSLIMLVALQASKKVPGANDFAATAFKAALASGPIATNAQNFTLNYPGGTYKSPWWFLYNGRTDWAESKTMTDFTKSTNDARQQVFGGSFSDPGLTTGGTVSSSNGVPYGVDRTTANNYIAANADWALVLRADKRAEDSPVPVITAAEVALATAEAINIGWVTGDLVATYQNGIRLSHEQWGVDAPSPAYLANANVAISPTPGDANTKNISVQRWVSSYPDGHMGWDIWRKTGFPVLTPAPAASNTSKKIVRRFIYATSEQQTNGKNVNAAIAREIPTAGTDSQDNAVWWDVIGQTP